MLSKKCSILLLLVILMVSVQNVALSRDEDLTRDADTEWQVLTELNRWRLRKGLGPLMRNPDLDVLAMQQAAYIGPQLPDKRFEDEELFHLDPYGDGIVDRAAYYGWPPYDSDPNKELISEIAAYSRTVNGAIGFWQGSKPHRDAVQTAAFREAGVAVLRRGNYMVSYVELGGRPDVLPVMFDPSRNMLYLSTDTSYNAEPFRPLYVRILDGKANRLHQDDWLVWSERIRLPLGAPNNLTVIASDGIREITTQVDLTEVYIFPSDPDTRPPQTTTLSTYSPIAPSSVAVIGSNAPVVRPTPLDGEFQVRMVYNDTSFSLINQSVRSLDLSKLVISSNVIRFSRTAQWLGRYSKVPLTRFPPTWCMQVWSFQVFTGPPGLPADCSLLASGRSLLNAGDRFWLANRFDISYAGHVLVTCFRDDHECGFDVPTG